MPVSITRYVRVIAWISLVFQVVIVVTGGAVRLTASGLGCPQWPTCDGASVITTPEMGIHGVIEFTNRTLTFGLVIVAIAAFLSVWRLRRERKDLFWLTLWIGLGIPVQAVIGGISVWMKLNPYVVGLHFVVSMALIVLATLFVLRSHRKSSTFLLPSALTPWVWLVASLQVTTVILGILTTGSGPHAGDANAPRNNLDPATMDHLHSVPAYATIALTVVLVIISALRGIRAVRYPLTALLSLNVVQAAVGISQSRLGLPVGLVAIHMLLASVIVSVATLSVYRTYGVSAQSA